jgi:hypothetical protein
MKKQRTCPGGAEAREPEGGVIAAICDAASRDPRKAVAFTAEVCSLMRRGATDLNRDAVVVAAHRVGLLRFGPQASLPTELQACVFSYICTLDHLRVLERVCRGWRDSARSRASAVAAWRDRPVWTLYNTHMRLRGIVGERRLAIRSSSVQPDESVSDIVDLLPQLTSIDVHNSREEAAYHPLSRLSQLHLLTLHSGPYAGDTATWRLPVTALHTLHLVGAWKCQIELGGGAASITDLNLSAGWSFTPTSMAQMTRLRVLTLAGRMPERSRAGIAWSRLRQRMLKSNAATLASLEISELRPKWIPHMARMSALTRLMLHSLPDDTAQAETVSRLAPVVVHLCELEIHVAGLHIIALLIPHMTQMRQLTVGAYAKAEEREASELRAIIAELRRLPRLAELDLTQVSGLRALGLLA